MATIAASPLPDGNFKIKRFKWLALTKTTDDVGAAVAMAAWPDRSVQVFGTFGTGGACAIEGSNDGGTTWKVLTDPQGNALSFTAAGIEAITELVHMIRPHITAGDVATLLDVYLMMGSGK